MSENKTAVATKEALPVITFQPVNEVPHDAPVPQVDWNNPNLSFDDVLPSNYFSMEELDLWLQERGAESRVLTVTGCSIEYVYDPEKGESSGNYKPCLSFEETATMLVINKTRGMQLKTLTRSPFLRDWATVGQVAIKPGIGNGKAQILITAIPGVAPAPASSPIANGKFTETTDAEIDEMFSHKP